MPMLMPSSVSQVPALPVVGPFAERLLIDDLPRLATDRRREVVAFVAHRVDTLPSFTRFGVLVIGSVFRVLVSFPGGWGVAKALMRLPLPFVAEYPRLIRSLSFAYVWEHWPATTPAGDEATGAAA
jgi:hypothetical protein